MRYRFLNNLSHIYNKSMREPIKLFSGQIIGYIEDQGSRMVATDFCGRILGYYNKSNNATTDFSGRIIAYGNILAALIWEKR